MEDEKLSYDIVVVGAGPAGLSFAIRLKQLQPELSVCVIEKAATIGGHTLSGAILDTVAINQLIPNWQQDYKGSLTTTISDKIYYLNSKHSFRLPLPKSWSSVGYPIVNLGEIVQYLAEKAESLAVDIFPGFSAASLYYIEKNGTKHVQGIKTGEFGLDAKGEKTESYQQPMLIESQQCILAEGARGYLSEQLIKEFKLNEGHSNQTYGIGIKEVWHVNSPEYKPGNVIHTTGWPLDSKTYGGGFIYQKENQLISLGIVIGLDYQNPYIDPFLELQRLKTHSLIKPLLENGELIQYGARALTEGGYQSVPTLAVPGAMLIGCAAGLINVPRIKGIHNAMLSGMLAAESTVAQFADEPNGITDFDDRLRASSVMQELYKVRNIRPSFKYGAIPGIMYSGLDNFLLKGNAPWTFSHHEDYKTLNKASSSKKINYPKPDGKLTFDKLTALSYANVGHRENQVAHLKIQDNNLPLNYNLAEFDSPETRYCPAQVYEVVTHNDQKIFRINAQNCLHCKTCDIKDPKQNIIWMPPEGGGGPNYTSM